MTNNEETKSNIPGSFQDPQTRITLEKVDANSTSQHENLGTKGTENCKKIITAIEGLREHLSQMLDVFCRKIGLNKDIGNISACVEEIKELDDNVNMNKETDINTLKSDIRDLNTNLNWIKWTISILVTIGIFVTGYTSNSIKESNKKDFEVYTKDVNSKFELIQKELESQKEINQIDIEKGVAQEILRQKR